MKLKFKNRIAFFLTVAAATSTFLVFMAVYLVVYRTAYRHLDNDIRSEKEDIFRTLKWSGDSILLEPSAEWTEREHERVEVNPTFLQITDKNGALVFLSANMKNAHLRFDPALQKVVFFNNQFHNERIRQGQFPIVNAAGQLIGHLSVGISQVESALVLQNLRLTLLLAFPLLTLIFYGASSFAAAQGIAPIHRLIQAANDIDDQNMATRLPLPPRRDEIYKLATTINELLARIAKSMQREKQITADISHELRTPLAGIRGTLEVLLRKPREPEHYVQKIEQVLHETDRMNKILEQLLQLSRLEAGHVPIKTEQIDLQEFFRNLLKKWQPLLVEKQTRVEIKIPLGTVVAADANLLEMIVGNLFSNALKYGLNSNNNIGIFWNEQLGTLTFQDDGPGIPAVHLAHIFDRFYRTDASRNGRIAGTGLGLSIAKKMADLQSIDLTVESVEGHGTAFLLQFPV